MLVDDGGSGDDMLIDNGNDLLVEDGTDVLVENRDDVVVDDRIVVGALITDDGDLAVIAFGADDSTRKRRALRK